MADVSSVYFPEIWSAISIDVLFKSLVMANLVHRDFENDVSQMGDTVNTRLPDKLTVRSWAGQEDTGDLADNEIIVQRPTATNVAVVLDNHKYVSFMEEDKARALSVKSIREEFVMPAIVPLAEDMDDTIMTEMTTGTDVAGNAIAEVQAAAAQIVAEDIVNLMKELNSSECPPTGRRLVLGTEHHADALKDSLFVQADQSGSTTALQEANLGRKFGFDTFFSQNVPENTDGPQSLGFHRNSIAFVTRPLGEIPRELGVSSSVANDQGYSARVITSYKHRGLGIDVTMDALWGTKLLHAPLAKRLMG